LPSLFFAFSFPLFSSSSIAHDNGLFALTSRLMATGV
jgi:hypothetical protein